MKTFTRVGAVFSFLFCSLGGLCVLIPALSGPAQEGFVLAALGLFLVGMAFFFGSMLWLTGEKCSAKPNENHHPNLDPKHPA